MRQLLEFYDVSRPENHDLTEHRGDLSGAKHETETPLHRKVRSATVFPIHDKMSTAFAKSISSKSAIFGTVVDDIAHDPQKPHCIVYRLDGDQATDLGARRRRVHDASTRFGS